MFEEPLLCSEPDEYEHWHQCKDEEQGQHSLLKLSYKIPTRESPAPRCMQRGAGLVFLAPMKGHAQAMARGECDQCHRFDWMAGYQTQLVLLRQHGQGQVGLHHGKRIADAQVWPAAKGKIGIARAVA